MWQDVHLQCWLTCMFSQEAQECDTLVVPWAIHGNTSQQSTNDKMFQQSASVFIITDEVGSRSAKCAIMCNLSASISTNCWTRFYLVTQALTLCMLVAYTHRHCYTVYWHTYTVLMVNTTTHTGYTRESMPASVYIRTLEVGVCTYVCTRTCS